MFVKNSREWVSLVVLSEEFSRRILDRLLFVSCLNSLFFFFYVCFELNLLSNRKRVDGVQLKFISVEMNSIHFLQRMI